MTLEQAVIGLLTFGVLISVLTAPRLRRLRAAKTVIQSQHDVVAEHEVTAFRAQLPPEQRADADRAIRQIRDQRGAVRVGHLVWLLTVLNEGRSLNGAPSFAPATGAPYAITTDIGIAHFRQYIALRLSERLPEAYEQLRRGADLGSPLCLSTYGGSLLRGDVPGLSADPKGLDMMRRAAAAGASSFDLADVLLEGVLAPRDIDTALELLRRRATVDEYAAFRLAEMYIRGLHGVPRDPALGTRWAMMKAPLARRVLNALGKSQTAWVEQMLALRKRVTEHVDSLPHHEVRRSLRERMRKS